MPPSLEQKTVGVARYPWWLRFHYWFIVLTFLYSILIFAGLGNEMICIPNDFCPGHPISHFLGFFVPIGPFGAMAIIMVAIGELGFHEFQNLHFAFIGLLLLLGALFFGERIIAKFQFNFMLKAIANLFVLLLLTFMWEVLNTGTWQSLILFTAAIGTPIYFSLW